MDKYMGGVAYPSEGTHTVEVSLQWGEYKGTIICKIGGNTMGASIIDSALDSLVDGNFQPFQPDMSLGQNHRHIVPNSSGTEAGYVKYYRLFNASGDELHIDYDDIADCIIGVQIVGWEASD